METVMQLIRRYPLSAFFVLAYGLSWWPMLWDPHGLFPAGPLLAAVLVLAVTGKWPAVREFLRRMVGWRVHPVWYALVLGLPAAIALAGAVLNPLFGAASPVFHRAPPIAELLPTFVVIFLMIGVGEEPAWRGFALPGLARGRSLLVAALPLAGLHGIWHLPLFGVDYTWANVAPWMITLAAYSVMTAWLYIRTAGNLLLPALFHASVNVSAKYLFLPLFEGEDLVQLYWIWAGLWWVAALVPLARIRGSVVGDRWSVAGEGSPEQLVMPRLSITDHRSPTTRA
jgi:membrane protease YdiL (CAAX protease family)